MSSKKNEQLKTNLCGIKRADIIRPYGWRFVGADIIRPLFLNPQRHKI